MAVFIDMLGGGGPIDRDWHPPKGSQAATYTTSFMEDYEGSLGPDFGMFYLGTDHANLGLNVKTGAGNLDGHGGAQFTPTPYIDTTEIIPYQSTMLVYPWCLAWMTQVRQSQMTALLAWDLGQYGSVSACCCFSRFGQSPGMYVMNVAKDGNTGKTILNVQRWYTGNVIGMSAGYVVKPPNEPGSHVTLMDCGEVNVLGNQLQADRVWLQCFDLGNAWKLSAWVLQDYFHQQDYSNIQFRGEVIDSSIEKGMPAVVVGNWSSAQPITFLDLACGWGPHDYDWTTWNRVKIPGKIQHRPIP